MQLTEVCWVDTSAPRCPASMSDPPMTPDPQPFSAVPAGTPPLWCQAPTSFCKTQSCCLTIFYSQRHLQFSMQHNFYAHWSQQQHGKVTTKKSVNPYNLSQKHTHSSEAGTTLDKYQFIEGHHCFNQFLQQAVTEVLLSAQYSNNQFSDVFILTLTASIAKYEIFIKKIKK